MHRGKCEEPTNSGGFAAIVANPGMSNVPFSISINRFEFFLIQFATFKPFCLKTNFAKAETSPSTLPRCHYASKKVFGMSLQPDTLHHIVNTFVHLRKYAVLFLHL